MGTSVPLSHSRNGRTLFLVGKTLPSRLGYGQKALISTLSTLGSPGLPRLKVVVSAINLVIVCSYFTAITALLQAIELRLES